MITRICRDDTTDSRNATLTGDVEVVGDPLDGTAWVAMASWCHARDALTALNAYGISGHDCQDGRLHVTGWDIRLLHWRLGALLAGVDDLAHEWDATAELVCYHHDRRVAAGVDADPVEVLADVETAIRRCVPFPRRTPCIDDVDTMLELITAADDAYQQLIAEHVDYAERALAQHTPAHPTMRTQHHPAPVLTNRPNPTSTVLGLGEGVRRSFARGSTVASRSLLKPPPVSVARPSAWPKRIVMRRVPGRDLSALSD